MTNDALRKLIREIIQKELEEETSSSAYAAGAGPVKTPYAFKGTPEDKKKHKENSEKSGYTIMNKMDFGDQKIAGDPHKHVSFGEGNPHKKPVVEIKGNLHITGKGSISVNETDDQYRQDGLNKGERSSGNSDNPYYKSNGTKTSSYQQTSKTKPIKKEAQIDPPEENDERMIIINNGKDDIESVKVKLHGDGLEEDIESEISSTQDRIDHLRDQRKHGNPDHIRQNDVDLKAAETKLAKLRVQKDRSSVTEVSSKPKEFTAYDRKIDGWKKQIEAKRQEMERLRERSRNASDKYKSADLAVQVSNKAAEIRALQDKIENEKQPMEESLTEGSYMDFRSEAGSVKQKIGRSIQEINRQISEIDRTIRHASRLKTESGFASDHMWRSTSRGLVALEQRLINLTSRIRELKS